MAFDRSSKPTQSGGRRDAIAAEAASFWQAAVTRLAREINLGWWLAGWLPWRRGDEAFLGAARPRPLHGRARRG